MSYRTLRHAGQNVTVFPAKISPLSRSQRLERWADLLDRYSGPPLRLMRGVEFGSSARRIDLREEDSPLTVAFEDPVLRACGLTGDRYGDALRFFGVRHGTLHEIVCYCHYATGASASPAEVAIRVRRAARHIRQGEWLVDMLRLGSVRIGAFLSRFA
jgi:hypothetical protein